MPFAMSLTDFKISVKEVIFISLQLIALTFFLSSQSSKIDNLTEAIKQMTIDKKESGNKIDIIYQNIQNQVNSNSLQIKLMQQDLLMIKQGYYPTTIK
jgi:hypothetical protein